MMEAVINPKSKSNRWQALLIFLIPAIAMGAAWFMYFTGVGLPEGRTNKGELILPPTLLSKLKLQKGTVPAELNEFEGYWGVLVFGSSSCELQGCQESLYKTRQVHIALGKDSDRLVRLFVAPDVPTISADLKAEHPGLFWFNADQNALIKSLNVKKWPENKFYIVDPLGNIIMQYNPEQAGGDLLKDLRKLMKASKIG